MNGWETKTLGELCRKITDGVHHTPKYTQTGIPFLSVKNLTQGVIDFSNTKFISLEDHKVLIKRCKPEMQDVLYTKVGTTGIAKIVDTDREFSLFVSVALLKPKHEIIFNKYLEHFLNSKFGRDQARKRTRGMANKNLVIKDISEITISYPVDISEQKRIVAILDEAFEGIDRAIANTEKNLANSRELFESYLNAIFTQKNNRWEWVSLSEITTDITDGDHQPPPKSQSGIPFITISNIDKQNRKVDFSNTFKVPPEYFEKLKSNRKPRKGDLLYTVTGSYGIPVIVDHDIDFCFQRHIGLIRPNAETNSKCLYYILLSRYLLAQADECATGTAQKTVSLSGLRRFSVPKIPKKQQEIFVAELDALSEKIGCLESIYRQKIAALNELKQSILQKAFTGELTTDTLKTAKQEIAA